MTPDPKPPTEARRRGRPPKSDADLASVRVEVLLTKRQAVKLDAARGAESRSAYLARKAGL